MALNIQTHKQHLQEAADYIKKRFGDFKSEIAVALGTGLGNLTNSLTDIKEIPYTEIPHMPNPTVSGHSGRIVFGFLEKKPVICLAGRSHAYEGIELYILTFTARLMALLGVKIYIATNASGGSQQGMYEGCLMIITDHINFYKRNPLSDTASSGLSPENPDFSELYSKRLKTIAQQSAEKLKMSLFEGVYGATSGPSYETRAETKLFSEWSASCFGMSTIPETMSAHGAGLEVFGMAFITNLAAGINEQERLTHGGVTDVASSASGQSFIDFMKQFLSDLTPNPAQKPFEFQPGENAPLPQERVFASSLDAIRVTKQEVITLLGIGAKTLLSVSEGHEYLLSELKDKRELKLDSIADFPKIFPKTKYGIISSGLLHDKKVICLSRIPTLGLACEEASFLADLFLELGVTRLIQTAAVGATLNATQQPLGEISQIIDYVDAAFCVVTPKSLLQDQFLRSFPLSQNPIEAQIPLRSYFSYPGPSFPTPSEVHVARQGGFDFCGPATYSLTYALSHGLKNQVMIAETRFDSCAPSRSMKNESQNEKLIHCVKRLLTEQDVSEQKLFSRKRVFDQHQMCYNLQVPVTQGSFDDVEKATQFLQNQKKSHTNLCIIIDTALVPKTTVPFKGETTKVLFSDIPFLKDFCRDNPDGHFLIAENVLAVNGCFYLNQGLAGYQVTFIARMLKHLKISNVLHVSPLSSVSHKNGQIVQVSDHCMLTGRNPLFGHNEDRWGIRFFDVQEFYGNTNDWKTKNSYPSSPLAHLHGPLFYSKQMATFLRKTPLSIISTGIAPEALAFHHMEIKIKALGIVTHQLDGSSEWDGKEGVDLLNSEIQFLIENPPKQ